MEKRLIKNYKGHSIYAWDGWYLVDDCGSCYETCAIAEGIIDKFEFKFEIGKIYKSYRGDDYIKITGKTPTGFVSFVHISKRDGHEYTLGDKRKKPCVWERIESLHLPIGIGGIGYPAYNVLTQEEFDKIVKENIDKANAKALEVEKRRIERQAKEREEYKALKEKYGLSLEQFEEIYETLNGLEQAVIEELREEEK